MKSMKYIIIAVLYLFTAVSCEKFEEINTDPNKTTKVTSAMLATQILKDTYRFWNPNASDFIQGNLFNKHIAYLDPSPYVSQYYYSNYPYGSFGSFARLTDLKYMVQYAEGGVEEPSYRGLALYLKAAYGFSATLDMGDIPYSEAGGNGFWIHSHTSRSSRGISSPFTIGRAFSQSAQRVKGSLPKTKSAPALRMRIRSHSS